MFGDGALTMQDFAMKEPLPLARIHQAVLDFLRNRDDAVLLSAQAVNAYVDEPRMTQDVDILSTRASNLADEIRAHLAGEFGIAVRIREAASGRRFRIYQLREPKNRHLVDVRQTDLLPPNHFIAEIRVPTPEALIAQKVVSLASRSDQPKGDTDRRDAKMLLLKHPNLKSDAGAVMDRLLALDASPAAIEEWHRLALSRIDSEPEDAEF